MVQGTLTATSGVPSILRLYDKNPFSRSLARSLAATLLRKGQKACRVPGWQVAGCDVRHTS